MILSNTVGKSHVTNIVSNSRCRKLSWTSTHFKEFSFGFKNTVYIASHSKTSGMSQLIAGRLSSLSLQSKVAQILSD